MTSRLQVTLLTAVAVTALAWSANAKTPAVQGHQPNAHKISREANDHKLSVLYDQTSDYGGYGMVSQNFGDQYDSAAIDDFMIPNGAKWTIKEVDVFGFYFNGSGPADSEDIIIYQETLNGFDKANDRKRVV